MEEGEGEGEVDIEEAVVGMQEDTEAVVADFEGVEEVEAVEEVAVT